MTLDKEKKKTTGWHINSLGFLLFDDNFTECIISNDEKSHQPSY